VIRFAHILCPIDIGEVAERPLAVAATLARWYDARLTVLHVAPTFDAIPVRPVALQGQFQYVQPPSRDETMAELQRAVDAAAGGQPLKLDLMAEAGDPVDRIVDLSVALPADLVVMGTHGRGGFERLVLGSVAEQVLRRAPCPVLTVPPRATTSPAETPFRHILCPIDFSASSQQALGYALDLARQSNGDVTVLHVIEWPADDDARLHAHFNVADYERRLAEAARDRLRGLLAADPRTWASIREVIVHGRPYREVLRLAGETPADLIVMGAQGRGGLGLALFGSTTQQVLRAAPCPVLTVRLPEPGGAA
jgi:nucleotide-binding universal stress UspA family protein